MDLPYQKNLLVTIWSTVSVDRNIREKFEVTICQKNSYLAFRIIDFVDFVFISFSTSRYVVMINFLPLFLGPLYRLLYLLKCIFSCSKKDRKFKSSFGLSERKRKQKNCWISVQSRPLCMYKKLYVFHTKSETNTMCGFQIFLQFLLYVHSYSTCSRLVSLFCFLNLGRTGAGVVLFGLFLMEYLIIIVNFI